MTTPVSMPAGHKIVATDLDAYENLTGAFVTFSTTWRSSGTQPVLNNGTLTGVYRRTGQHFDGVIQLTIGSTSTFGTGLYTFDLPFASARDNVALARVFDSSSGNQFVSIGLIDASGSTVAPMLCSTNAFWTSAVPMTWATGDTATIHFFLDAS